MPLPLGHALAGTALYAGLDDDGGSAGWRRLLVAVFLANAPDLDLVPGILIGDPNRFHHGMTHSLVTAVVVGLLVGWLANRLGWSWRLGSGRRGVAATALMVALLLGSHVVLDSFTRDTRPPIGVPALWPISEVRVNVYPLFGSTERVRGPAGPVEFARSLVSLHNLGVLGREALFTGPLALLAWGVRRRRRQRT